MSGHSKWATIKHKKGALDAKRGRIFTKLIKEITVAARAGGGDVNGNARLRKAISDAKSENMPNDTIDKAVKRGTGELEGATIEEITYEGYGPGGVAVMVEAATDNKNRTVAELRHMFSKNGGNLGESGCVAWMFSKKGVIILDKTAKAEDELLDLVLNAGGEDLRDDGEYWEILASPDDFDAVLEAVKGAGLKPESAEVRLVAQNYIKLEGKDSQQVMKLIDLLDDHDDVQKVASNADFDTDTMEAS